MKHQTIIAAALATLAATSAASADPVRMGIAAEPYPPFMYVDASGKWIGWEVEILDAVCKKAGLDCVITPVAWDGIIPSLTGNQIDFIAASMSITEDREKVIDFTDAYYNTPAVIVADKSSDITATPEGLAGKIIGVQSSTIHATYAEQYFAGTAAEVRIYQRQDDANQDLASGRIDAIQADSIAMLDFVNSDGGACCEVKGNVADDPAILGRGVGAGVRKGDDALRQKLNEGITAVKADGTYAEVTARYFATNVFTE